MSNKLYVSPSPDGWRNLAVDEYFLDHTDPGDMMLYFYVNANAVIIGRGQNPWAECNLAAMDRDGVQLVRRITGGGEFSGRNDLLADGRKFSGNAFCARGRARQHHGTLLIDADLSRLQNYLNVDPRKLKSKGAKSVRSRVCNLREFMPELTREAMLAALKDAYRAEYGDYTELAPSDLDEAAIAPYEAKQASDEWRLGNTPRFDVEIEHRLGQRPAAVDAAPRPGGRAGRVHRRQRCGAGGRDSRTAAGRGVRRGAAGGRAGGLGATGAPGAGGAHPRPEPVTRRKYLWKPGRVCAIMDVHNTTEAEAIR